MEKEIIKNIYLAGGCFWGTEKYLSLISGVVATEVGYANGKTKNPSYEDVCRKGTGHAETVKVSYSGNILLKEILEIFYEAIDPTQLNRQGNDIGTQYRSGIYYVDEDDKEIIENSIADLAKKYAEPIQIEVMPLINYYKAEEYHQKYLEKNPYGYCHIGSYEFNKAKTFTPSGKYCKKSKEELKKILTDIQYKVTQENATEPPFENEYNNHFEKGIYVDITTGEPLFSSDDKFQSHCGWPSFAKPITKDVVVENMDSSHDMRRIEVRSKNGDAHLGHVFDDGPAALGGLRYCINSAAIKFVAQKDIQK